MSASNQASSCSWHLATYVVGWILSACGIGLMVLSSDVETTRGNWLVVLVGGISCAALGGTLIIIAVSIPDSRGDWCRKTNTTPKELCKKHEGVYIRFGEGKLNDKPTNGHKSSVGQLTPLRDPTEVSFTSTVIKDTDFLYKTRSLDNHLAFSTPDKYNGNLYVAPPTSWSSTLTRASYEDINENTAIMFYRETPV